jgi:hypothetical protein
MVDRTVRITQRSARRTTLRTARSGTAVAGAAPVPRDPAGEEIFAAVADRIPSGEAMVCLERLAELHREGVLSCEEFAAAKVGILGIPPAPARLAFPRSSDERTAPE